PVNNEGRQPYPAQNERRSVPNRRGCQAHAASHHPCQAAHGQNDPERVHGATAIVCDGPAAHFREIEIFPLGARLLLLDGAAEMAPPGRTPGNGSFSDPKIVKVLGFAFGQVPGAAADLPIRSNSEDMPTVLVDVEPMPAVRRQFAALNGPVPE